MKGRVIPAGFQDSFQDPLWIVEHIIVPKSQDPISLFLQPLIPRLVFFVLQGMLAAVTFNNDAFLKADEVNDKWTDGGLTSEFQPLELF